MGVGGGESYRGNIYIICDFVKAFDTSKNRVEVRDDLGWNKVLFVEWNHAAQHLQTVAHVKHFFFPRHSERSWHPRQLTNSEVKRKAFVIHVHSQTLKKK